MATLNYTSSVPNTGSFTRVDYPIKPTSTADSKVTFIDYIDFRSVSGFGYNNTPTGIQQQTIGTSWINALNVFNTLFNDLHSRIKYIEDNVWESTSTVNVTSITLNKSTAELAANGTMTLTATVNPSNATNKSIVWEASNDYVTLSANTSTSGNSIRITWQHAGQVTITAKSAENNSKQASCIITCNQESSYYYYNVVKATSNPFTSSNYRTYDGVQTAATINAIKAENPIYTVSDGIGYRFILLPNELKPFVTTGAIESRTELESTSIPGYSVYKTVRISNGVMVNAVDNN